MLSLARSLNKYYLICFLYSCIFFSHYTFAGEDCFLLLPDELKLKIAANLPLRDVIVLSYTCKTFNGLLNPKEKLKILSRQYYGPSPERYESYKKAVKNKDIAPIQGLSTDDVLLKLAYRRYKSNRYLASLEKNKQSERTCIATLTGHTDWVRTVTALPDGRVVSGSSDKTLKVWDLNNPEGKECIATLTGHENRVRTVTVLPDGRVVSGADDNTLKVWDLDKPKGYECISTAVKQRGIPIYDWMHSQYCQMVEWFRVLTTRP